MNDRGAGTFHRRMRRDLANEGWASCDHCGKRRPRTWARLAWWKLGGIAGYYDFCSEACEKAMVDSADTGPPGGSSNGPKATPS